MEMETVQAAFFDFKSSLHLGMGGKRWAAAAWVWRRNAMPTAATHRLCGKKSSLHDTEAVQAPFNPL